MRENIEKKLFYVFILAPLEICKIVLNTLEGSLFSFKLFCAQSFKIRTFSHISTYIQFLIVSPYMDDDVFKLYDFIFNHCVDNLEQ